MAEKEEVREVVQIIIRAEKEVREVVVQIIIRAVEELREKNTDVVTLVDVEEEELEE